MPWGKTQFYIIINYASLRDKTSVTSLYYQILLNRQIINKFRIHEKNSFKQNVVLIS